MTQTLSRSTSWRRLRRKAVAGGSAAALAVGLGVAVVPSAMAATGDPTLQASFEADQMPNDGTSPATLDLVLNNTSSSSTDWTDINGAGAILQVTLQVPGDNSCSAVSLVGGSYGDTANENVSGDFDTAAPGALASCVIPIGLKADKITKNLRSAGSLQFNVTGTALTGTVTATFGLWKSGKNPAVDAPVASATDTIELVKPHGATAADSVATPTFAHKYQEKVFSDVGFTASTFKAVGYDSDKDAVNHDVSWSSLPAPAYTTRATGTYSYVDDDGNTHDLITLNNDTAEQTGYFFDTRTGEVVYGTSSGSNFTPKAVASRTVANQYDWIIVANNGNDGATAGDSTDLTNVTLNGHDVATPAFYLVTPFTDVSDSNVFKDAINDLAKKGIVKGYTDGTFGVKGIVTRKGYVMMAARLLDALPGISIPSAGQCNALVSPSVFSDVPNNSNACAPINALASIGVINGYANGTFRPNAHIQRGQLAAFTFRTNAEAFDLVVQDAAPTDTQFDDVPKSNVLSGDIQAMANAGLIKGQTSTKYGPADDATRQAAAGIIWRIGDLQGLFS